jgi:hypothetical protein
VSHHAALVAGLTAGLFPVIVVAFFCCAPLFELKIPSVYDPDVADQRFDLVNKFHYGVRPGHQYKDF